MNYIYHISSIATTFGPLSKVTILGQKCMAILGIRRIQIQIDALKKRSLAWWAFSTPSLATKTRSVEPLRWGDTGVVRRSRGSILHPDCAQTPQANVLIRPSDQDTTLCRQVLCNPISRVALPECILLKDFIHHRSNIYVVYSASDSESGRLLLSLDSRLNCPP